MSEYDESLTKICIEIVKLAGKLDTQAQSTFAQPATDQEIASWEQRNGVQIPEQYKSWLKITKNCRLFGGLLELSMPSITGGYYSNLVTDDLVVIGNMIGDGERICFVKATGEFVRYDHGGVRQMGNFENILYWALEFLRLSANEPMENVTFVAKYEWNRRVAVNGFWNHERELINQGKCTRGWNPDEMEEIMNISTETGNKRTQAVSPKVKASGQSNVDENGFPIHYECHRIHEYWEYPDETADWRVCQALTPEEHMLGAHQFRK